MRDAQPAAARVSRRALFTLVLAVLAALFAAPVAAQEAPVEETIHVVVGTGDTGLALRAGPGLTFPTLGVLPEGTSVRILDGPITRGQLDWFHIELTGAGTMSGYSTGTYLAHPGSVAAATSEVAPDPTPPQISAPTEVPSAEPSGPPPGSRVITAKVTGYANGSDGGAVGFMTASGTRTHWGTVAADIRLYPFGTKLMIEGFGDTVFVVEDTGSGVRGDIIDVWFPDVPTAVRFGTQRRQVTLLPPGR